jgi:predicted nuclease of predicted toxin-antitoxin system
MKMNILVDETLKNEWCKQLEKDGHVVKYWPDVKNNTAPDQDILDWAKNEKFVVLTKNKNLNVPKAKNRGLPCIIQIKLCSPAEFRASNDPDNPERYNKYLGQNKCDLKYVKPILKEIQNIENKCGEGKRFKIDEDGKVEQFVSNKE